MEKKKFYMTTAIAYTSGKPHIGNTYEIVLADSIARLEQMNTDRKLSLKLRRPASRRRSMWITWRGR